MAQANRYPLKLRDLIVFPCQADKAPASIVWGTNNGQGQSTALDVPVNALEAQDCLHRPIMFSQDNWLDYKRTKMWIDPSGGGSDKTGYAVTSMLNGTIYLRACGADPHGHTEQAMRNLSMIARRFKVNEIHVEDFALQSMFKQVLEPILKTFFTPGSTPGHTTNTVQNVNENNGDTSGGWRCSVTMTRPKAPSTMKELRMIQALEPVISTHRLVVDEDVARSEEFQRQLTRLCEQRNCLEHEDELDATANAVQLWEDYLGHTQADA